jgi:site-specific DNA recombinase
MEKVYAMLLRLSRDKKEADSLQNHREILEAYAAAHNLKYEPIEYIVSGMKADVLDRPDIQQVLAQIDRYKGILVYDISRIARDVGVGDYFKKMCKLHELEIVTPYYRFDFSDPMQESMYENQIQMAATEGRMIAKRHKDNKMARARRGEWIASDTAFGYARNKETRKLVIVEEEAEIIRKIFKLHNEGLGSYKIRDILNAEGTPAPRTAFWNLPSIKRIIKNEVYKGTVLFNNRKEIMENGKKKYKVVETIRAENAHDKIIDLKTWFEANTERVARAEKFANYREKPATKSGTSSLKDLVYCGCCHRKHTILLDKSCNTGYVVKVCHYLLDNGEKCGNAGIRLAEIEKRVFHDIKREKAALEKYLLGLEQNDNSEHKEKKLKRLEQIKVQLNDLDDKDTNLLMAIVNGGFTAEKIDKMKSMLATQRMQLEGEKEIISGELKKLEAINEAENVKKIIDKMERLEEMTPEEQNQALKTFIKKIHYTRTIPEEIKKLSTRNPLRKNAPFKLKIEYIR